MENCPVLIIMVHAMQVTAHISPGITRERMYASLVINGKQKAKATTAIKGAQDLNLLKFIRTYPMPVPLAYQITLVA